MVCWMPCHATLCAKCPRAALEIAQNCEESKTPSSAHLVKHEKIRRNNNWERQRILVVTTKVWE